MSVVPLVYKSPGRCPVLSLSASWVMSGDMHGRPLSRSSAGRPAVTPRRPSGHRPSGALALRTLSIGGRNEAGARASHAPSPAPAHAPHGVRLRMDTPSHVPRHAALSRGNDRASAVPAVLCDHPTPPQGCAVVASAATRVRIVASTSSRAASSVGSGIRTRPAVPADRAPGRGCTRAPPGPSAAAEAGIRDPRRATPRTSSAACRGKATESAQRP